MPGYSSSEIKQIEYLVTLEDGKKQLILSREDGSLVELDLSSGQDLSVLNATYLRKTQAVDDRSRMGLRLPPKVMTSPPTVTLGLGGAASAISGSTLITPTDSRFRYYGALASYYSNTTTSYSSSNAASTYGGITSKSVSQGAWGVEFDSDADSFEIASVVNTGGIEGFRIAVDGEWITQAMTPNVPASGSGNNLILVANGSRKMRTYRVEFNENGQFRGINLNQAAFTIWEPVPAFGPRAIVFGDSFTSGADGNSYLRNGPLGYVTMLGELLGWRIRPSGVSGSGYINTGGTATYRGRIAKDLNAPARPGGPLLVYEYVVIAGGINDYASEASAFTAEIPLLYAAIRAVQPTSRIIVVLPFNVSATQQLSQAKTDAIRAAWVATGGVSLIIDPIYGSEGPWFTGSGYVGTPSGNGNADFYRSVDGLHPSSGTAYNGGHDYIGRRIASKIIAAMPLT